MKWSGIFEKWKRPITEQCTTKQLHQRTESQAQKVNLEKLKMIMNSEKTTLPSLGKHKLENC